jgi:hypothetical protein
MKVKSMSLGMNFEACVVRPTARWSRKPILIAQFGSWVFREENEYCSILR